MISQCEATIYLGEKRGCVEVPYYRSYRTFNFGAYENKDRPSFNDLIAFNDDVLAAGSNAEYHAVSDSLVVIIPVAGTLLISINNASPKLGEVGVVYSFAISAGDVFRICNSESDTINFLNIWKKREEHTFDIHREIKVNKIALEQNIFSSIRLAEKEDLSYTQLHIGKFGGRIDCALPLKSSECGVFAFVLEGAFEINERLLHARDGLALRNLEKIELEALSNDAIVVLVE